MQVIWEQGCLRLQSETEEDHNPRYALQRMIDAMEREVERIKAEGPLSESDSANEEQSATVGLNR